MSVDKAKEFLIDVTEDESAAARIQDGYLRTLVQVSKDLGYDLTTEDLAIAIEEMSGLDDPEGEVEGFALSGAGLLLDSFSWVRGPASLAVIADPLGFRGFGRRGR